MPGQLPTPALHKRIYLIFLWVELYQIALIPILNPLLKTVCILELDGVHDIIWNHKNYDKITNNSRNQRLLLVLTCYQCDNIFKSIIDECIFALIIDRHYNVYLLPIDQEMANGGLFLCQKCLFLSCNFQC